MSWEQHAMKLANAISKEECIQVLQSIIQQEGIEGIPPPLSMSLFGKT